MPPLGCSAPRWVFRRVARANENGGFQHNQSVFVFVRDVYHVPEILSFKPGL